MADLVKWHYQVIQQPYDPIQGGYPISHFLRRYLNDELTHSHFEVFLLQDALWDFYEIRNVNASFDASSFQKSFTIVFIDRVTGEEVLFDVFFSVPPFNNQTGTGTVLSEQLHFVSVEVAPPVMPPPITPPWPRPVKPEPPIIEPVEPPEPPPPCGQLDRETFREFWALWGHQVDKIGFEVPLDDGMDIPTLPEPYRALWRQLTHHRIDVVFTRKKAIYVAEIKPRLSVAAIGIAIVARTMFMEKYDVSGYDVVKGCVICQYASPILVQVAGSHYIAVFVTRGLDGLYEPKSFHDVLV